MEASCVFYVLVSTLTDLEQSKSSSLHVNISGIVRRTVQHDLIGSVSFMYYPWRCLRQSSEDVLSMNIVGFVEDNHAIQAVVDRNFSLLTNTQQRTDILQIPGLWGTTATGSYMQQNSSWVWRTCSQQIILFWHEATFLILRASHFFSLSSSSPIPHKQMMDTQQPQPCWAYPNPVDWQALHQIRHLSPHSYTADTS